MNSLISIATLLAFLAWTEGALVIEVPGLTTPPINRGTE
jgi:hypothetical protein